MGIESIFSKSFEEFKKNILLTLKVTFWFGILPLLILLLIFSFSVAPLVYNLASSVMHNSTNSTNMPDFTMSNFLVLTGHAVGASSDSMFPGSLLVFLFTFLLIVILIFCFIAFLVYVIVLFTSIYNEKGKMTARDAFAGAKKYFWRVLGLMITIFFTMVLIFAIPIGIGIFFVLAFKGALIITIPLLILLILSSITLYIFLFVRWSFAIYILVREDVGIIESIRRSNLIITGKWWKVLGYTLLFGLVIQGISSALGIFVYAFFWVMYLIFIISTLMGPIGFAIGIFIAGSICIIMYSLFISVMNLASILLQKNLYLEIRTGKIK